MEGFGGYSNDHVARAQQEFEPNILAWHVAEARRWRPDLQLQAAVPEDQTTQAALAARERALLLRLAAAGTINPAHTDVQAFENLHKYAANRCAGPWLTLGALQRRYLLSVAREL